MQLDIHEQEAENNNYEDWVSEAKQFKCPYKTSSSNLSI